MTIRQNIIRTLCDMVPDLERFATRQLGTKPYYIRVDRHGRLFQGRTNPAIPNTVLVGCVVPSHIDGFDMDTWHESIDHQVWTEIPQGFFVDE